MVVTRSSSKPQTKTRRRSRVSAPKYSKRQKKKFDFAVYDKKLAGLLRRRKLQHSWRDHQQTLQLKIMIKNKNINSLLTNNINVVDASHR